MNLFINKALIFFTVIIFLVITINFMLGFSPYLYSNSISLNAKIFDIKKNHLDKEPYLICYGSSMSLNNIYSPSFNSSLDNQFINISSWGQSIEFTYKSIRFFDDIYNPNLVLLSCNIGDFHQTRTGLNPYQETEFKSSLFDPFYVEWNFLRRESREYHKLKKNKNSYKSLAFDDNGGVSLNKTGFIIDPQRWTPDSVYSPESRQYLFLDSVLQLSAKLQCEIIIVQTPLRESYIKRLSERESQKISKHIKKIESQCLKYNIQFINGLNLVCDDSLFVDYSHLNTQGSKFFSDSLVKLIRTK